MIALLKVIVYGGTSLLRFPFKLYFVTPIHTSLNTLSSNTQHLLGVAQALHLESMDSSILHRRILLRDGKVRTQAGSSTISG